MEENDIVTEDVKSEDSEVEPTEERDPEPSAAELAARLRRAEAKIEKMKLEAKVEKKVEKVLETKSGELDYGQKAFLVANGVKGADEVALVKQFMENTGKSLDDIVENAYFQQELKGLRETRETKEAIPSGAKRTGQSSRNEVDYWLAKGELPPEDQPELRRAYVNARIARESSESIFTSQPIGNLKRQ